MENPERCLSNLSMLSIYPKIHPHPKIGSAPAPRRTAASAARRLDAAHPPRSCRAPHGDNEIPWTFKNAFLRLSYTPKTRFGDMRPPVLRYATLLQVDFGDLRHAGRIFGEYSIVAGHGRPGKIDSDNIDLDRNFKFFSDMRKRSEKNDILIDVTAPRRRTPYFPCL